MAAQFTRRRFLHAAAPLFIPAGVLGKSARAAANERLNLGFIGAGGRGSWLVKAFINQPDVQIRAICDTDARHARQTRAGIDEFYAALTGQGYRDCVTCRDFRELVGRSDLDAVVIATPDHWHALASIAAARAGKDAYCEKPLANSLGEGRAIVQAVTANRRILQVGSHERSNPRVRQACEIVRNKLIGDLTRITVNLPCDDAHHKQARSLTSIPPAQPVPAELDYDLWLGHTPVAPYCEQRVHFWWRFILAYGGGEMTDRGAHVLDIAQLGADRDGTGPVAVEAKGVQTPGGLYDAFWDYEFTFTYADALQIHGTSSGKRGLKFEGTEGWVFVNIHGGKLEAEPASVLEAKIPEGGVALGRTPGHQRNFLDCVKTRQQPLAPAEAGHRTASLCHLANLAMKLQRRLNWDPVAERVLGDDEANSLLTPTMRPPWRL